MIPRDAVCHLVRINPPPSATDTLSLHDALPIAIGAAVVVVNILVSFAANLIAPYDPLATDYGAMLARPSGAHWLGTDAFGRDVLSRIIYGSRTAMLVGFACALIGATVGTVIGVTSAYFAGRVDLLIQRVMDIF